jgi:hypothetical protein
MLAVIIVPFQTAATTLLYYDLRQRIEGTDLEERIKAERLMGMIEPANRVDT